MPPSWARRFMRSKVEGCVIIFSSNLPHSMGIVFRRETRARPVINAAASPVRLKAPASAANSLRRETKNKTNRNKP